MLVPLRIGGPRERVDPELVAMAIVFACEHDRRDIVVGFGGWAVSALGAVAPRVTDYIMEVTGREVQESSNPGESESRDNLYTPREDGAVRSSLPGGARKTSMFLEAQLHPVATIVGSIGVAVGIAAARALMAGRKTERSA
ncbi:MAG: hypothetical protein ABW003_18805 [Microvirga sp.]